MYEAPRKHETTDKRRQREMIVKVQALMPLIM